MGVIGLLMDINQRLWIKCSLHGSEKHMNTISKCYLKELLGHVFGI